MHDHIIPALAVGESSGSEDASIVGGLLQGVSWVAGNSLQKVYAYLCRCILHVCLAEMLQENQGVVLDALHLGLVCIMLSCSWLQGGGCLQPHTINSSIDDAHTHDMAMATGHISGHVTGKGCDGGHRFISCWSRALKVGEWTLI